MKALSNNHDLERRMFKLLKSPSLCAVTHWSGGEVMRAVTAHKCYRTEVLALDEVAGAGSVHVP